MKEDLCDYYKLKIRNSLRKQRLNVFIAYLRLLDKRFFNFTYDITARWSDYDTLKIYGKRRIFRYLVAKIQLVYEQQEEIKEDEKEKGCEIIVYDREYYNALKKFGEAFGFEKILKCWDGCENEM